MVTDKLSAHPVKLQAYDAAKAGGGKKKKAKAKPKAAAAAAAAAAAPEGPPRPPRGTYIDVPFKDRSAENLVRRGLNDLLVTTQCITVYCVIINSILCPRTAVYCVRAHNIVVWTPMVRAC